LARSLATLLRDLLRLLGVLDRMHGVARLRDLVEPEHFHRRARSGRSERPTELVGHRPHLAPRGTSQKRVADAQRSVLNHDARDGAATTVEQRLDDDAAGAMSRVGAELEDLGL